MKSHTWTNLTHVCRKWCAVARSHRPPVWIWGLLSDISRQSCRVICRFPSTTIARMKTSLEVPSGACVPHSDITIACAGSFLQGGGLDRQIYQGDQLLLSHTKEPFPPYQIQQTEASRYTSYIGPRSPRIRIQIFIVRNGSHQPLFANQYCLQSISRNVSSSLSSRHVCLHRLDLSISSHSLSQFTTKDIVLLSKLTYFHYVGHLDALVAGLSTPSLGNVDIEFADNHLVHRASPGLLTR